MGCLAKTGTTTPEAFVLTWLIYGLLPLTLTAGLGSNMPTTQPLVSNSLNNITTPTPNAAYNCPASCQCDYSSSSQKFEINCSQVSHQGSTVVVTIDLSPGVRVMRISHAVLDAKSVTTVVAPLVRNTLVELDLHHVTIEPKSFFNSNLFKESSESLRKITITRANLQGDFADVTAANFRDILQPLASLKNMDSLNICDSSPGVATVVLQAMPAVNHLRAVNNSLYDIPYESISNQYSIQSMDFSRNHFALIPNGLMDELTQLLTLDVSHNRIFHLQEQVFSGLQSLRKLNISHNKIEYVDAEVFTPLRAVQSVDLSHNDVIQFFEPYFGNNKKLEILNLSNMWVKGTFTSSDTAFRSLMEIEQLISTLHKVERLDISANGMTSMPETLTHAPNLLQVYLDENQWECSCHDRWFLDWVTHSKITIGDTNTTENMWCYSHRHGEINRYPFYQYLKNLTITCTNSNIIARTPCKFNTVMGKDKQLSCHAQKPNWPKLTWITPSKQQISASESSSKINGLEPRMSADGSLLLTNVTKLDYGLYLCIASYEDLNITHYVHLGMDVSIFRDVKLTSIFVGWTFSLSFLVLVLLVQLIKWILEKLGVRCCIVKTTRQTVRVRAFFESIEQHKTTQLDWLRDNYNMQAKKIKENCYSQLDRIRESYSTQSKNLGDIRDYGTQQLYTLRDQYNDQVRKVAGYSAHQLCKVRENYVFKRNQVCKFSSHQLLRLRETYKWQAQTLSKILENLPRGLNFDTCRGMGTCGRTESIYLDDMGDFDSTQDVAAHVYQMNNGEQPGHDKLEHVSLLIPPEFVYQFRRRPEEGIIEEVDVAKEDEETEPESTDAVSSSTPPTATLESCSSISTPRRGSCEEKVSKPSTDTEGRTEDV